VGLAAARTLGVAAVTTAEKVVTLEAVVERAAGLRAAGQRIALANGVFDLLHVGHVRYLEGAKALADVLVVAVNSDRSTRAYKGPDRPLVPEAERAELVAALACTDLVVIFDEPDVRHVIRALRPELHVKGTDYTEQSVPERAEVEAYGGRVAIAGDPKDHSTTALAGSLRGR
jgi:rfaE bifunctional protein nucleotidyltransferase chain/domain